MVFSELSHILQLLHCLISGQSKICHNFLSCLFLSPSLLKLFRCIAVHLPHICLFLCIIWHNNIILAHAQQCHFFVVAVVRSVSVYLVWVKI